MSRLHQAGLALLVGVGFAFAVMAPDAAAAPQTSFTLTDDNSVATFDLASDAGMSGWTVEGTNQLAKQWFWYRIGTTGDESSIDTLSLDASAAFDMNGDTYNDSLYARYLGTGFKIEIRWSLDGGLTGSRNSLTGEQISITNTSTTSLNFHFFQYTDFNLGGAGDATDDQVIILLPLVDTIVYQWDPDWEADTALVVEPDYYMAGDPATILALFSDSSPTTLSGPATAGPGDVAWALQWDFTLKGGRTYLIGAEKLITPEPATLGLMALGGLALLLRQRR